MGVLGGSWVPLGRLLGASWAPLGRSWAVFGTLRGRFWSLFERAERSPGPRKPHWVCGILRRFYEVRGPLGEPWAAPGSLWSPLGRSWAGPSGSWARLGPLSGHRRAQEAVLYTHKCDLYGPAEVFRAVANRRVARPKSSQVQKSSSCQVID